MNKFFKLALVGLAAAQEEVAEATTARPDVAEPTVDVMLERNAGTCWACGVKNNVTDFGPQDSALDMYNKCQNEGVEVECYDERTTCAVVERKDGQGAIMSIEAGCKARDACRNNQLANFNNNECERETGKPSKCVDCCLVEDGDNCNLDRWPLFIAAADATEVNGAVLAAWNNTLPEVVVEAYEDQQEEDGEK